MNNKPFNWNKYREILDLPFNETEHKEGFINPIEKLKQKRRNKMGWLATLLPKLLIWLIKYSPTLVSYVGGKLIVQLVGLITPGVRAVITITKKDTGGFIIGFDTDKLSQKAKITPSKWDDTAVDIGIKGAKALYVKNGG